MADNFTLDRDYIKSKIQEILNHVHPEHQKRVIRDYPNRINFACPVCTDSEKVASKKRGNLYLKRSEERRVG